ncbi:MAG: MarR family transcriptional regulator [Pseudomonadota bacterium]
MARGPSLPDHIGWDLIRAARLWEARFTQEMVAAGHGWFGEARGRLMQHIGPDGVEQSALTARAGTSKQAVAKQVDALVDDGIVARKADPADARKMRVVLTEAGRHAMEDADAAKARVEAAMADEIGAGALATLREILKSWAPDRQQG